MKTPCQKLGYKVGDKFQVLRDLITGFKEGATVTLFKDDGSDNPLFSGECYCNCADGAPGAYIDLHFVKPIEPKKAKRPWIKWEGGECPVPEGTLIDVKHRDGEKYKKVPALGTSNYHWDHAGYCGDIVAYRLAKPKEAAEPAKPEWEILWGSAEDFEGAPDWAVYVLGEGSFTEDVIKGSRLMYWAGGPEDTVSGLANSLPKAARRLKQPK